MSNLSIDTHNIVSTKEVSNVVEKMASALIKDPSLAKSLSPILLRSAPGVGKSTIVREVAEKLGIGFIDIRLSQMEPVDLRGLPVPNHDDKSVEWYVTSDLPRDPKSKGIILFDEITAADRSLQVASYELILDRRLGKLYKLPDGWYIVAAGNRTIDKAVSTTMSSALANRFLHFDVEADIESWREWAVQHDIHPSVVGYLSFKPDMLHKMTGQNVEQGWPSPRSWERVSNIINMFDDEHVLRKAIYGLVGPAAGLEFFEFHKLNDQFDDVLKIMTDPKAKVKIPTKIDRRHAMASAATYLVWNSDDEEETKKRVDGLYRIALEMTPDFATMIFMNAMLGNKRVSKIDAIKKIAASKLYPTFKKKFEDALARAKNYQL